jgi:predicted transcriptional regulator
VALWVVCAVGLAVLGALALRAGRQDANAVREAGARPLLEGRTVARLERAADRFSTARGRLTSPVLAPLRLLPVVGRQLRSAGAIAGAAEDVAREGLAGVALGRRELRSARGRGVDRVAQIRRLGAIAERTDRRVAAVHLGPSKGLVGPLGRARQDLATTVADVRRGLARGSAASTSLADLLAGPRSYLVFAANPSEMRAGSGMFLSVGNMRTGDGRIEVSGMASVNNVAVPAGVPIDGDLAARWGWLSPQTDWRNLMLSPRFAESAELAARMWEAGGRPPVDGVLVLDAIALRAVLAATGPVQAAGLEISEDNVVEELVHTQYTRFPNLSERDERRESLSAIATAVVQALSEREWSAEVLADGLAKAARGRHVLLWSSRPSDQRGWAAAGLDGAVRPDSLMVSVLNRGGNKLDYWLPSDVRLELRAVGDHTEGTVRMRLRNTTPPDEPTYVAGPHFGLPLQPGEYLGLAAITLPGTARAGRFEGVEQLAVAGADGPTRVIATEFRVERGEDRTLVVRFRLPGRHGSLRIESSAREPSVPWTFRGTRWRDDRARTVRW